MDRSNYGRGSSGGGSSGGGSSSRKGKMDKQRQPQRGLEGTVHMPPVGGATRGCYSEAQHTSTVIRTMSNYQPATDSTRNPRHHLIIGVLPGWKVNCGICDRSAYGDKSLCFCNKCKKYLHPRCAGVLDTSIVLIDGREQVLLPAAESLPQSCRKCLRKQGDSMMINRISQLSLQQSNSTDLAPFSSSLNRFLELGTKPAHQIVERKYNNKCMIHKHSPGHQLRSKDDWNNYNCSGCKMEGFGLHYSCENSSCSFLLHEECMSPPITTTRQDLFPGVTFSFHSMGGTISFSKRNKKTHSDVFCNVCGMEVNGYYYHTHDGTTNIHPCCMKLTRKTKCGLTGARMVLRLKSTFQCIYCNRSIMKLGNKSTQHGWSYVAESDNIQLHVGCMMKMMAEVKRDSMGRMISFQMSRENGAANMTLKLAVRDTMAKWEEKFKGFTKYPKMVLGAIIAALTGDPIISTTLLVKAIVYSLKSQQ